MADSAQIKSIPSSSLCVLLFNTLNVERIFSLLFDPFSDLDYLDFRQ